MRNIALLIDWENLRKEIESIQKNSPEYRKFNYNDPSMIHRLFLNTLNHDKERLYRIFFYTALPLHPDKIVHLIKRRRDINSELWENYYSNNKDKIDNIFKSSKKLLYEIVRFDYIALRLGDLQIQGQASDGHLIMSQKKVDMLIGLDIAHLAYNKLSDEVRIYCKDKDLAPALKTARINGLNVSIANLKGGYKISNHIYRHIDTVYNVDLINAIPTGK